uniref:Sof1-like protein domain-containing protein n=1 Tax=Leersia perrieri TaxID=77586 RepID=A0A0D9WRR3_9ORYZ
MRGGADSARRRDGRAAEDEEEEEEEEEEDADLAGAARRREADERSSDLAAAAAIVGWIPLRWGEVSSPPVRLVVSPDRVAEFPASPSPPAAPLAGMRVKVVSRSTDEFTRERSQDLQKVFRNYDPALRTQEKAVEYTRALNAAKLEKIFARPFIGAMDGHVDDVSCMAKNPNYLKAIFSGSMDGAYISLAYIRLWDIASRKTICQFPGHQGAVRGLATSTDGDFLVSCGVDCTVRLWKVPMLKMVDPNDAIGDASEWDGNLFATVGAQVDIWDQNRSEPINSFEWGKDTVLSVRFNPGEPDWFFEEERTLEEKVHLASHHLVGAAALWHRRWESSLPSSIWSCVTTTWPRFAEQIKAKFGAPPAIFTTRHVTNDGRAERNAKSTTSATRCNSICWNPREPMNFTAANEDTNCYSFDARKLDEAKVVHKGHVSAVMDIDYSPTGREFVTGSYDRTVRLFQYNGDHSREIYHTKRMQRVFCVKYTYDGTYLVSGSDDTNLRLWKSKASEQLGVLLPRERRKQEYLDAVKERYKHLPEVKRIVRHRHLPKPIYKAGSLRRTMVEAENRKEVGGHTVPL